MSISDEGKRSQKFVIIDSQPNISKSVAVRTREQIKTDSSILTEGLQTQFESDPEYFSQEPEVYDKKKLKKRKIIHPGMKNKKVLNAFRSLRMTLQSKMESTNSIILVSAVNSGGGASFTAINLATAFTLERGRRALVVDCNLAEPTLTKKMGVDAEVGLVDYLSGSENEIDKLVYSTDLPRVELVPCNSDPAEDDMAVELFNTNRMQQFLNEVKSQSTDRTIVLDAPPVLDSADTKILAEISDLIVVALPYKGVTPSRVSKTVEELGGKDQISGFVMVN